LFSHSRKKERTLEAGKGGGRRRGEGGKARGEEDEGDEKGEEKGQ
jgi:hypothetical protein